MGRYLIRFCLAVALCAVVAASGNAQTQQQFPNSPWNAFAPARIQCGRLLGANFNAASTDQAIYIQVPSAQYMLDAIVIDNASVSLTTAQGGFYTGAGQTGTAVVANTQAYSTLTAAAFGSNGSAMTATLATAGQNNALPGWTYSSNPGPIYFNLTTAQGAAATADIRVYCRPLY